jgi:cell division protein FtsI/penicillin-binding protein 2
VRRRTAPDRFWVLLLVLTGILVSLAGRLAWIQGLEASAYAKKAADQRTRDMVVTPRRGVIYDREGEPLAISVDAKTVYAVPTLVKDPASVAATLAATLGGKAEEYERKLRRRSSFVYIARKVDLERAKRLEAMDLKGIGFLEDSKRTYPSGELACQVLGFVGVDDKGLSGIELQYDGVLGGKAGSVLAERDPYGMPIPGGVMRAVDKVDGRDIVLTIDKDIQYQAQLELAETVRQYGAKSASVVVMDPRNGELFAMASTPSFDPNAFRSADPRSFTNQPTAGAYEPGSTMKTFTAAGVIDKGLFRPDSRFDLPSTLKVGGKVIHEAHGRGRVEWTLSQIIEQSSNVGAVKLGIALGKESIYDYYSRFGIGQKTGVDLPEVRGILPVPQKWSRSSIGNIPFGQGLTVTPLQLARALAGIASAGELPTPHLLLSVQDSSTPVWQKRRAVSAETARAMTAILEGVVSRGTGGAAAVKGYTVAGKTGTAQIAKHGGYASGAYMASFAGFLPADDPRVLIVVVVEEPTKSIYGGTVAAPVFSRLGQFTVNHFKIPPSASASEAAAPSKSASSGPRD